MSKQNNVTQAMPKLLTPKQIAAVLQISYETMQRMLRRRQIRSVQIGASPRTRRVTVAELQRWINQQMVAGVDQQRRLMNRRRK